MKSIIPVNEPLLKGNEKKYVIECIKSGWISSEGPFVKKFEEKFKINVKRKYAVSVSNGTAALEIAVRALNIGSGDEVIMPTFTIISCAGAVIKAGAKPVLVDSELTTWNMDVNQIEKKITKKTKAIMVVHIYGLPVDLDPILEIAKKYNLKIIEDSAEMHGQKYKGNPCGSFGDLSVFSFYPNKHITTGEGGMIVTDNKSLEARCKSLRNLCFKKGRRFVHDELGWNYRFTNLQAAVGLAQLENLHIHIQKKKEMGKLYGKLFSNIDQIQLPLPKTEYAENIFWVFGVLLKENASINSAEIMKILAKKGIGTRPFFYPMHKQPVFNKMGLYTNESYPVSEKLSENGFYIPSGIGLRKNQILTVAKNLKNILR